MKEQIELIKEIYYVRHNRFAFWLAVCSIISLMPNSYSVFMFAFNGNADALTQFQALFFSALMSGGLIYFTVKKKVGLIYFFVISELIMAALHLIQEPINTDNISYEVIFWSRTVLTFAMPITVLNFVHTIDLPVIDKVLKEPIPIPQPSSITKEDIDILIQDALNKQMDYFNLLIQNIELKKQEAESIKSVVEEKPIIIKPKRVYTKKVKSDIDTNNYIDSKKKRTS